MRNLHKLLLMSVLLTVASLTANAQVKVGNNPTTINASALVEMESTTKGMLPPRMTTTQRSAIASPASGLIVYNTDLKCVETNLGTPASPNWACMATAGQQRLNLSGSGNYPSNGGSVVRNLSVQVNSGISYNPTTGDITVLRAGDYHIAAMSNGAGFAGQELVIPITGNDHCLYIKRSNGTDLVPALCARSATLDQSIHSSGIVTLAAGDVIYMSISASAVTNSPTNQVPATSSFRFGFNMYNLTQ